MNSEIFVLLKSIFQAQIMLPVFIKKMKGIIYNHSKYKIEISFFAGFLREPELSPLQLCLENVHRTLQRSVTVCSQLLVTGNAFLNWAH